MGPIWDKNVTKVDFLRLNLEIFIPKWVHLLIFIISIQVSELFIIPCNYPEQPNSVPTVKWA